MKNFEVTLEDGTQKKLVVRKITAKDSDAAETAKAARVASLIKSGEKILSRLEVDDYLKANQVWTDEDNAKVQAMNEEVHELLNKLRKGGIKLSEGREIAVAVNKKRIEILRVSAKRRAFDEATIEAQAENERNDYLTYLCTVTEDTGERFWNSWEELKEDRSSDAYYKALSAVITSIYGDGGEFEKNLPENKWLRKYNFVNDELQYIDRKTGSFVDEDNNPITQSNDETIKRLADLAGDIIEEQPFVDDFEVETKEETITQTDAVTDPTIT